MFNILKLRNYLFFKIFSWFWLTILFTLLVLFILSRLTDKNVESQPLHGPKLIHLKKLTISLQKAHSKKPEVSLQKLALQPRLSKRRLLLFINQDNGNHFFNRNIQPPLDINLLTFTHELSAQDITTAHYRALGPVTLVHNNIKYLFYDIEPWRTPPIGVRIMLMPTWLKIVVILGATLLFSLLFSRTFIKPINALKRASSQLANGNLSTRVDIKTRSNDELTRLATDFNIMAQRLESLVSSQKRLMADVSHELRSPLTRLKMAAGLAQLKQTPEQVSYLERIENEANSLEKMIADVLKLARLEANNQYIHKEATSLQSVLNTVLSDAEFEAKQRNKILIITGKSEKTLNLDAALIASGFENILRNAITYASHTINCDIVDKESHVEITISDDGSGVNEADLPHILEPFYRVSQSRQRQSGGTGLGLAIAQQAIALHNGSISLKNKKNSGLQITISL